MAFRRYSVPNLTNDDINSSQLLRAINDNFNTNFKIHTVAYSNLKGEIYIRAHTQPTASEEDIISATIAAHAPVIEPSVNNTKWILKDVKSIGTNGGTFTANTWTVRDINTLSSNDGDDVILNNDNTFTCVAGKYSIECHSCINKVDSNNLRLYNTTESKIESVGLNNNAHKKNSSGSTASLNCMINITSTSTFQLEHICSHTRLNDGFGEANGFGEEIYTKIIIIKQE